jgi:ABC-type sugar transport system ATPase subunit
LLPRILEAFQATTVLVTHSRDEALRLADDLVVLVDGHVQAAGPAHEVVSHPRVIAVAEVLGYTVLATTSRTIAVPPGAMRLGGGHLEFSMTVNRTVDMVGSGAIVGRIGDVVVRIPWTEAEARPKPGDHITVHAERFFELT